MDNLAGHELSLRDLEWPEVCSAIAHLALSDLAKAEAHALGPTDDQAVAETRLSVMKEVLLLKTVGFQIPASFIQDIRPTVESIRRGGVGSAEEVAQIAKLLRVAGELDRFGANHEDSSPLLGRVLAIDGELGPLARTLSLAIDEEGFVRDDASVGLASARAELRNLRSQVQKRIEELIGRYREALQDGYFAERDGRYVLPVRSDAPFRVEGIVLGTSSSGSTLYVEPKEMGQLGNRLRLAEVQVEREISLILSELSEALSPHADELLWAQGVCVRADLILACARFSAQINAVVVEFAEAGVLSLREARHPLLCLSGIDVVANDLEITPEVGLVLSGPNAGGKTVALKTLGLLALMQSSGLPVPAHPESRIGFFSEVLSDIGDDQSLSMSLSSFSGHVQRVKGILEDAGHGTLVLFDELMGGTDPDEGAVLAIATVDELLMVGASVCVTTHYEPLKDHGARSSHLVNAAVGYDFEKMEPTFKVEMGRPGASSALIVAERHGLPTSVTQKALDLLPKVVADKRQENIAREEAAILLEAERNALQNLKEEQETLNRRLERELLKAQEARRRDLTREGDALRQEIGQARAEVRALKHNIKSARGDELRVLTNSLDKASSVVAIGSNLDRQLRSGSGPSSPTGIDRSLLVIGTPVRVAGFSTIGKIVEKEKKGKVRVLVGVMKMSVPVHDIELATGGGKAPAGRKASSSRSPKKSVQALAEVSAPQTPVRSDDVVLDLRGKRVEESLLQLDHFIDELLRRQEMGAFVLHGHGTGAMKDAVRQHLRGHPCVFNSRAAERDEGGDAFTVFWLGS